MTNYRGQSRNYNSGNRYNNNYTRGYGQNESRNNPNGFPAEYVPVKKHSGARIVQDKKGTSYVTAWNYSKERGLISAFVAPYKNTSEVTSGTGKHYVCLMCTLTFKRTGQQNHFPVLMNTDTSKVVLKDMGMIINPKAPNGGYFGQGGSGPIKQRR